MQHFVEEGAQKLWIILHVWIVLTRPLVDSRPVTDSPAPSIHVLENQQVSTVCGQHFLSS